MRRQAVRFSIPSAVPALRAPRATPTPYRPDARPGPQGVEPAGAAVAAPSRPVAGGKDGGEIRRPERSAPVLGRRSPSDPPVTGQDPGGPGKHPLPPPPTRSLARPGRGRGARRGRQQGVAPFTRPAVELGVKAAGRPGIRPAGVRG